LTIWESWWRIALETFLKAWNYFGIYDLLKYPEEGTSYHCNVSRKNC
jgi:hypothetical protein